MGTVPQPKPPEPTPPPAPAKPSKQIKPGSIFDDDIETLAPVRSEVPLESEDDLGLAPLDEDPPASDIGPAGSGIFSASDPSASDIGPSSHIAADEPAPEVDLTGSSHIGEGSFVASPSSSSLASFSRVTEQQAADADQAFEEAVPEANKPKRRRAKRTKQSEWDSSLILYGGGGLLVLIISGIVIYYLLNRENADSILQRAGDYFDSGSYTQAISEYQRFVDGNASHPQYSSAKVRLGMARLWKDTSSTSNYATALATAQTVIDDIEDEKEFRSAQRDLASLIPKIAQGLATQAEQATDPTVIAERVTQTEAALSLAMNTKYVPKEFRDEILLGEVEQALLRVDRNQEQTADLAAALTAIDETLAAGDISSAYDLHSQLVEKHPALLHDDTLTAKVQAISAAEAQAIQFVPGSRSPTAGPRESPLVASLALADQQVTSEADVAGTLAVRLFGGIYGLQASDGKLLWREYVGEDPRALPLRLENGDFLITDALHQEIQRLAGDSGKVLWRLDFPEPLLQPVVAGDRIFLATPGGKLHILDLESGAAQGTVAFGQRLTVPPTVDLSSKRLYIPGAHSSLYTLSTEDFTSRGVYYLGHSAGSIAVPVVRVLDKLFVAENTGISTCQLQVLSLSDDGASREHRNHAATRRHGRHAAAGRRPPLGGIDQSGTNLRLRNFQRGRGRRPQSNCRARGRRGHPRRPLWIARRGQPLGGRHGARQVGHPPHRQSHPSPQSGSRLFRRHLRPTAAACREDGRECPPTRGATRRDGRRRRRRFRQVALADAVGRPLGRGSCRRPCRGPDHRHRRQRFCLPAGSGRHDRTCPKPSPPRPWKHHLLRRGFPGPGPPGSGAGRFPEIAPLPPRGSPPSPP